jgi:hypothetical protein
MCDPYPDETISFHAMPDECPIKFLDYGIISEKIQDDVKLLRTVKRKHKKDDLFKKLKIRHLKECLYELDRLGRLDPSNAVIDLYKKKYLVGSKKKIETYLDKNFVPLVYLEEALEKQVRGPVEFKSGDWVKCKKSNYVWVGRGPNNTRIRISQYGIVVGGRGACYRGKKYVHVEIVTMRKYTNENDCEIFYPDFTVVIQYGYAVNRLVISPWDLEKVGEDIEATSKLRLKLKDDKEKCIIKKNDLWTNHLEPLLQTEYKERIYGVSHLTSNRGAFIEVMRNLMNRFWRNINPDALQPYGPELSEDEMFSRGVMHGVNNEIIPRCKKVWFNNHGINVLDTSLWENVYDKDNLLNKHFQNNPNCGFRICDIDAVAGTIRKYKLLD